jgi:hypothetical protein
MRRPAARTNPKPRLARPASFPAPVNGWIKNQNLAVPGARMPDGSKVSGAFVLENYFPTATGIRMRRGSDPYAQVGNAALPVASVFAYVNGNNKKLFASTASAIYDISSPAAPADALLIDDLAEFLVDDLGNKLIALNSVPTAAVSGLAGGDWRTVQFATPGGVFLRAVNGLDTPLVYDGAAWGTTPVITGVDPTTLSYVWVFKQRLFFIKKDTLSAYYLPADSIGGAAVELPLGGVFTRGGSLLFGSAWSLETGSGLSEQCAFVTTEGEVAIYQGTDPSVAANWTKVGTYRIGKPRGAKAHIRAGGDLVIATDIGFVPLSQAVQRDYSALSASAVSYAIETAWNEAVAQRSFAGWSCEVWPTRQMVLVAPPANTGDALQLFAANARTGAWGLFTGWNVTCLQLFGDRLFFGSTEGKIVEAEVTGADQGAPYTSVCVPLFDPLKAPASRKTSLTMRATLRAPSEIVPRLSLQADYKVGLPISPDAASVNSLGVWGGGIWGASQWGGASQLNVFQRWQSVGGSGYAIAPGVQITSANIVPLDAELVQVDMTYEMGDIGS